MPSCWCGPTRARATCTRPVSWSNRKGGCRLAPGHRGACKPGGPSWQAVKARPAVKTKRAVGKRPNQPRPVKRTTRR